MKNTSCLKVLLLFLLLLCFATGFLPQAKATDKKNDTALSESIWPQKVKVGGEFRFRLESQINYDFNSPKPDNDTFFLTRLRAYLDLNPADFVRLYAMFQDSETFDQESALVKTPDRHKFYQGFVLFKGNAPLKPELKMGREELVYGDQRLIGNNNWNNLARSFDGVILRLQDSAFWLDLFGTRIHPATNLEYQFAGAYGHLKNFPGGELEPYALYLHSDTAGLGGKNLSLATLGLRISAKVKKQIDYGFEGAYQTGENANNLMSAFALHVRSGYTFPLSWKPRLGLEFDYASGDAKPGSGKVTTFNNLFPTNHDKYGYMDLFSWRNMEDIRASVSASPLSWLKPSLDYHAFFLPEAANGVFMANGSQLRAGAPGAGSFAGQEIDFLLKFEPIKYFDTWLGYSVFFPGTFFADTGGSDIAQFFYAQLTARY